MEHEFDYGGEQLVATSQRALWWERGRTIFIADLHAGKTEHMRRAGLAIPGGSLELDLERLDRLIARYLPARLIVLGDLFHSIINREWDVWAAWCRRQSCSVELVRGNHDRFLSNATIKAATMLVHDEGLRLPPFTLYHHPPDNEETTEFALSGHLHPVVHVRGQGQANFRLPCFWIRPHSLILPSFGSFTGGYAIGRPAGSTLLACSSQTDQIIRLS